METVRSPLWIGTMLLLILVEAFWRLAKGKGYDGWGALTTIGLVIGNIPFSLVTAIAIGYFFGAAAHLAPFQWPISHWLTWCVGFIAVEFAYYWFHRASHCIRWFWATHSVHHSAEQITLLTSLRIGWTNLFSAGWVIYLPLILLGLPPFVLVVLLAFNLRYQFFMHTEAVGRLGPLEWVFNTPAHHRLHHASNSAYVNRNYGGVLIVFDRLFGTLAIEDAEEPIRYGLGGRRPTRNPVRLVLREWAYMIADASAARTLRSFARALFSTPKRPRGPA